MSIHGKQATKIEKQKHIWEGRRKISIFYKSKENQQRSFTELVRRILGNFISSPADSETTEDFQRDLEI